MEKDQQIPIKKDYSQVFIEIPEPTPKALEKLEQSLANAVTEKKKPSKGPSQIVAEEAQSIIKKHETIKTAVDRQIKTIKHKDREDFFKLSDDQTRAIAMCEMVVQKIMQDALNFKWSTEDIIQQKAETITTAKAFADRLTDNQLRFLKEAWFKGLTVYYKWLTKIVDGVHYYEYFPHIMKPAKITNPDHYAFSTCITVDLKNCMLKAD